MPDAPFSTPSSDQVARGGDRRPPRTIGDWDQHGPRVRAVGADGDMSAKRRTPLTDNEIQSIAARLNRHSRQSAADLALFYLLLTTGAKPLELARLRVKDVIGPSGAIRRETTLPAIVAINHVARPVFLKSEVAIDAIQAYVRYRVAKGQGVGDAKRYAGLEPSTPLVLDHDGQPYQIVESSGLRGKRTLCRGILDACRRVFRLAGIDGLCGSTLRRTLARRLSDRGATIEQIGAALGIKDRKAIRDLLDVPRIEFPRLFDEIVGAHREPRDISTENSS